MMKKTLFCWGLDLREPLHTVHTTCKYHHEVRPGNPAAVDRSAAAALRLLQGRVDHAIVAPARALLRPVQLSMLPLLERARPMLRPERPIRLLRPERPIRQRPMRLLWPACPIRLLRPTMRPMRPGLARVKQTQITASMRMIPSWRPFPTQRLNLLDAEAPD